MCLKVATKKLVAKTDLLVFKCLDYKDGGNYCTPFQYLPIKFGEDRKCVIKSGDNALTIEKEWDDNVRGIIDVINIGVHAYTKKEEAEYTASQFPLCGTKTFYAVIPKGCPYYIGLNFDVVTTELIVFRSKRIFDKYEKEHEIKEI